MSADLDRSPETRSVDRRSGNDRRVGMRRRRVGDREQLVTVTDEDAVRLRMHRVVPSDLRVAHTVPPASHPTPTFDAPRPRLAVRWWTLLRTMWGGR